MADFRDLIAYKKGFALAMDIFHLSKKFPKEEKYSLTSQVRRSSRSVCANISEAYRKRRYPAHFISKISDSDMENSETVNWLDFGLACGYISKNDHSILTEKSLEIGRLLHDMLANPAKYGAK